MNAENYSPYEERFELISVTRAFRTLGRKYWQAVVESAGAKILSAMNGAHIDAYLLSESSLFVSDDHVMMLTCGSSELLPAARRVFERYKQDDLLFAAFEKRFAEAQSARLFAEGINGAFADTIWNDCEPVLGTPPSVSLTWDSAGKAPAALYLRIDLQQHSDKQLITEHPREFFEALLPGYSLDDHHFSPGGYSLNAVRGRDFVSVHYTPKLYMSIDGVFGGLVSELSLLSSLRDVFDEKRMQLVKRERAASRLGAVFGSIS